MASELLRLEVVVRAPRARPLRGDAERHLGIQILPRLRDYERAAAGNWRSSNATSRVRNLALDALLVDDRIRLEGKAVGGRILTDEIAATGRRPLAARAEGQRCLPALRFRNGELA